MSLERDLLLRQLLDPARHLLPEEAERREAFVALVVEIIDREAVNPATPTVSECITCISVAVDFWMLFRASERVTRDYSQLLKLPGLMDRRREQLIDAQERDQRDQVFIRSARAKLELLDQLRRTAPPQALPDPRQKDNVVRLDPRRKADG